MLARLLLLLPAIGAALYLLGFKRTCDLLERSSPPELSSKRLEAKDPAPTAHRIAHLVGIAAQHGPYRATCLRQSLVLWWLLRRRGIVAELCLGVRKEAGVLRAHAWVAHLGSPLGHDTLGYAPFAAFRLPGRRPG